MKKTDSLKTDFKVTKPKEHFTGISLRIHYDIEKETNPSCSHWGT